MITAKEMRKIATGECNTIDESFLLNVQGLIKTSAIQGGFSIKIPLIRVNMSTMYDLKNQLDAGGFKYTIESNDIINIEW